MSTTEATALKRDRTSDCLPQTKSISKHVSAPQRWAGFQKQSNFILFLITAGIFALFCIARIDSLNYTRWVQTAFMGHRFWFSDGTMAFFMRIHLRSVIPAGIILPVQFIPSIRLRYPYFHRLAGRLSFILLLVGNITGIGVAPHSFGGTITTQAAIICLASLTTFTTFKSWTSIRVLHIDQHREWVLRTWSYACSILTLRIFLALFAIIFSFISPRAYRTATPCEEMLFLYTMQNSSLMDPYSRYPECIGNINSTAPVYAVVTPAMNRERPEEVVAMMNMCFGLAGWAAILVHALGVEIYLNATKDEDERLRKVSALKRKAAGLM